MNHLDSGDESSEGFQLKSDDGDQTIIFEAEVAQNNQALLMDQPEPGTTDKYQELNEKVHKEFQLIYIAAYSEVYRQKLQEIAHRYGCDLSFVKNSYIVSCRDGSRLEAWTCCKQAIHQEVNKIIYSKIQDKDRRFRIYNCLQVNRIANQKGIYLCLFNMQIYIHTSCLTEKELNEEKKKIVNCCIYPVCFLKKKIFEPIDLQIIKFFKTVLKEHYQQRFQTNNLIVELNRTENSVYILGKSGSAPKQMMEAKKTIKSLIEGLTIVAFKNNCLSVPQQFKMRQYLKQVSKFPITTGKLAQNVTVIISKDNILRDLLKKKDKIEVKIGIKTGTEIGIYIAACNSRDEKKEQVNKICKEMGYDYWGIWGIRYFRPMIALDHQDRNNLEILELIIRIIAGFNQVKDKYEIMNVKKQPENKIDAIKKKQLEEQSKYAYILKNSCHDSKDLMKSLRRDVTEDQVIMKKRYNVIYSLFECKQHGPFYMLKAQYDKGVDRGQIVIVNEKDLKKGEYFQIFFKIADESFQYKKIEDLTPLFIEELKSLKEVAKNEKSESQSYDKARKIAHMLKKLMVVF